MVRFETGLQADLLIVPFGDDPEILNRNPLHKNKTRRVLGTSR